MQVPSICISTHPSDHAIHQYDYPHGFIDSTPQKKFLKLKICSFSIANPNSLIREISLWHRFTIEHTNISCSKLNDGDILVLKGEGLICSEDLDHVKKMRCLDPEQTGNAIHFYDQSKKELDCPIAEVFTAVRSVHKDWLSEKDIKEISPKFQYFLNTPNIRMLKKMQYEARYLQQTEQKGTEFSTFLSYLCNFASIEKSSIPSLSIMIEQVKNFAIQMTSPRISDCEFSLTDPCIFMRHHEKNLMSHIKLIARNRLIWGCDDLDKDYFDLKPCRLKSTVTYMFKEKLEIDIIKYIYQNYIKVTII